jgi:hypothetical protein
MANILISDLQTYTGNTSGVFIVMNNSGNTESYKVTKETLFSGYSQNAISPVTGSWTLSAGTNTVSFTVPAGQSYVMWVNGNIPNGIINWNATVTLSNSNVPVIGVQYGWYYDAGGALVLTSIPNQIIGTAGIITNNLPSVGTTTNTFTFGITNNSGTSQIVYYGYIKVS